MLASIVLICYLLLWELGVRPDEEEARIDSDVENVWKLEGTCYSDKTVIRFLKICLRLRSHEKLNIFLSNFHLFLPTLFLTDIWHHKNE